MNLLEIKDKLDRKSAVKERLLGKRDLYMTQLNDLGFTTINKAESHLHKIQKRLEKLQKEYDDKLIAFQNKYSELLK